MIVRLEVTQSHGRRSNETFGEVLDPPAKTRGCRLSRCPRASVPRIEPAAPDRMGRSPRSDAFDVPSSLATRTHARHRARTKRLSAAAASAPPRSSTDSRARLRRNAQPSPAQRPQPLLESDPGGLPFDIRHLKLRRAGGHPGPHPASRLEDDSNRRGRRRSRRRNRASAGGHSENSDLSVPRRTIAMRSPSVVRRIVVGPTTLTKVRNSDSLQKLT